MGYEKNTTIIILADAHAHGCHHLGQIATHMMVRTALQQLKVISAEVALALSWQQYDNTNWEYAQVELFKIFCPSGFFQLSQNTERSKAIVPWNLQTSLNRQA